MNRQLLSLVVSTALTCGLLLAGGNIAAAVTPESREVKAVITKGLKFLEDAQDARLGGKCLIGMAFLKSGSDATHKQVVTAVEACLAATQGEAKDITDDIYSTGIAIIFLCTLDPSKYSAQIGKLYQSLELKQKSHGGWGYPERPTGDTSMTQYGVLSTWEISTVGLHYSLDSIERATNWLLRTQDPSGCWGYQGVEGEISKLVKQDAKSTLTMSTAALGCTYICADVLKLTDPIAQQDPDLPPALKLVKKIAKQKPLTEKVDLKHIKRAQEHGTSWFRKNVKIEPKLHRVHYYLYALERYHSFQEAVEGKVVKEPKWYSDGFAMLKKTQAEEGSWTSDAKSGAAVDTAFGVLFLLRSTKKSIERAKSFGGGALVAGRGLPADVRQVHLRQGRILAEAPDGTADELVDTLCKSNSPAFGDLAADPRQLVRALLAEDSAQRELHLARIRKLIDAKEPEARAAAARVLGQAHDVPGAPALIHALNDPDWRVVAEADDALHLLSLTLATSQLGPLPDASLRRTAIERWKQWYLSIAPDADFEN